MAVGILRSRKEDRTQKPEFLTGHFVWFKDTRLIAKDKKTEKEEQWEDRKLNWEKFKFHSDVDKEELQDFKEGGNLVKQKKYIL